MDTADVGHCEGAEETGVCPIKTNPTHDFIKMNLTAAMMTRRFWNMLCYALDKHHQSSAARRSMIKVKPVSCNLLAKDTEVAFSYFFQPF